jgi:mycofactocin system glycosyltransferase
VVELTDGGVELVTTLRLDRSWTRPGRGRVALGGSPLTLFRLTDGGVRVVEALESGGPLPVGHEPLTDRLLAAGAAHPVVDVPSAATPSGTADVPHLEAPVTAPLPADVTAVVPTHGEDPSTLTALVTSLRRSDRVADVIVVDDASPSPLAPIDGATVVRLEVNGGPGAARTAGAARARTPFVLFVDADVTIDDPTHTVAVLRAHLDDERTALVAPRVRARPSPGTLAAFEQARSPLDLGDEPARVRAMTRVSYVPAATLLVRSAAVEAVGGFDPALRFGEDVDLVWKLDEAGWRCRYEPAAVVEHCVRPDVRRWWRQRREYGSSAAALARRHPGALAPVRTSRWSVGAWALVGLGHPVLGAGLAAGTTVAFARTLGDVPDRAVVAARYAGLGNLHAGRILASALTRTWWPIALAAALVSRRARRVALVAVVVPAAVDWWRGRAVLGSLRHDPLRYIALRLVDDVAYGTGVWQGCLAERDLSALRPDITS